MIDKSVIELFAGVGGFRVAFNEVNVKKEKTIEKKTFDFVWENQWEPSTKAQHAFDCYKRRFNIDAVNDENTDITLVNKKHIPNHNILVGGFPCQDYSVAHSLSKEKGIEGKKGVLWWQIVNILKAKKTKFLLLENVDRLLKSPSKQRGRDFGIMLRCLNDLGYCVEWRAVNAADYGFPQKRKRIYIFAARKNTLYYKAMKGINGYEVIKRQGLLARALPIKSIENEKGTNIISGYDDLVTVSNIFKFEFGNSGFAINGLVYSCNAAPIVNKRTTLSEIIEKRDVEDEYFLSKKQIEQFKYMRGYKKIRRIKPNGEPYYYAEGAMSPYDDLQLPGRTMLTSEGTVNRSTHIIMDPIRNQLRFLTPVECERMNGFPDNWTNTGMSKSRRYFMMGNALVVGIIRRISKQLSVVCDEEK